MLMNHPEWLQLYIPKHFERTQFSKWSKKIYECEMNLIKLDEFRKLLLANKKQINRDNFNLLLAMVNDRISIMVFKKLAGK